MSLWQEKTINERISMVQSISADLKIDEPAVEKDWWVTVTLKALFSTSFSDYLRFKGGSSLVKGWKDINLNRFSEDIDITISRDWFTRDDESRKLYPFATCDNNNKIKMLRKASRKVVFEKLYGDLEKQLLLLNVKDFTLERVTTKETEKGIVNIDTDADPVVINVCYDSILKSKNEYIQPKVKIEISCLSMDEPFEQREITSLIYGKFNEVDNDSKCMVATVLPIRTFLEKAFLLNEEYQKKSPRSFRMSRHLYDLEKLIDKFAAVALANENLYKAIIEHRKKFYHIGVVDYNSDERQNIRICPPDELAEEYRKDYVFMQSSFIYDEQSLSYNELIERISQLEKTFHKI